MNKTTQATSPHFGLWRVIISITLLVLLSACGGGGGGGAAPGSDATLSGLTTSTGVLVSVFDSATLTYTVDVNNATASVTVTPTASSANATIKVNNVAVVSGSASGVIALSVGANPPINVEVTAADGTTTRTYTITVTRQAPVSTDATLGNLIVSAGTLAPVFGSATVAYIDLVPMASTSVDVTATTTSSNAMMTVNGTTVVSGTLKNVSVPVGQSAITIVVTAQDGVTTKTYTITVTRPGITLTPASSNITAYSSATLTVTLAAPSVGDTGVILASNSAAVTVPGTVTVLAGNTQQSFFADSIASGAANATITATLGTDSPTATVSVTGQCTVAADCPGTDTICQTRTCSSNNCGFSYETAGYVCAVESCSAGAITPQSTCDGTGNCISPAPISCNDNNQCTSNSCSGAVCSYPASPNGTSCVLMNATARCQTGACAIFSCSAGFSDCNNSAADGCESSLQTDANHCGSCGIACAAGVVCSSGACQNVCGDGIVSGTEACDDGNAVSGDGCDTNCTLTACGNGITAGTEQCDDGNLVNTDACTNTCKLAACGDGILSAGEACDDGNTTNGDGCSATCQVENLCTGIVCSALDVCHDAGMCDSMTGQCSNPAKADGTACSDGNSCTTTDVCTAGACGGSPIACTPLDACHNAGTCNPANGTCSNPAKADGTACDDANVCTTADACAAGTCAAGTPLSCDDGNECTADACDANAGCINVAVIDGTACTSGGGTACQAGTCL